MSKMISWDRDFSTINITDKDMLPNSYQIKLHIDITSDSLLKQNICFERIKFFIDYVVDKSVLVHKAHKKLKSIKKVINKQQWIELPTPVYDQSLGIALYCKLTAITYPHMDIKALEINSELGDDVNYVYEDDMGLGVYNKSKWFKQYDFLDPWWHREDMAAYDKIDKLEDGKITWYTGPLKWEDIGLGFDQNYKAKDEKVVDEALKNNVLQFPTKWTPKVIDGGLDKPTK
tara:strand:- start:869 stop:1561 length:693 start_codon:yes stop_codon:yes gene_type:complete